MLIAPPDVLIKLFEPWNKFYSDSKLAETLVMFAHTGGLLVAGGIAVATDRGTMRSASWNDDARRHHLDELAILHRTVVIGLTVTVLSGLLMLASDFETFWGSWIYWVKMAGVVVLLLNGAQMLKIENRLRSDPASATVQWGRLRTSAVMSMTLWLGVTLAGVALLNFA